MIKLRVHFMVTVILGTDMFFNSVFAFDIDDIENEEIVHLLEYIGNADCTFVRNGIEYSANHAKMFIEYKYGNAKENIDSTEEFIISTATKSQASGLNYKVRCNGNETASATWLAKELALYRNLLSAN